jgi:hypothetical protein
MGLRPTQSNEEHATGECSENTRRTEGVFFNGAASELCPSGHPAIVPGIRPRPFPAHFAGVARKTLAPSARHTSTAWTTSPNGAVPSACSTTGLFRRACRFSSASEA